MEIDRKTAVELAVSAFVIVAFTAGAYVVSLTYASPTNGTTNSSIPPSVTPDGGVALVGTIAAFVLIIDVVGFEMYRADFED